MSYKVRAQNEALRLGIDKDTRFFELTEEEWDFIAKAFFNKTEDKNDTSETKSDNRDRSQNSS